MIIKKHPLLMLEEVPTLVYNMASIENLTKEELMILAKYVYRNV